MIKHDGNLSIATGSSAKTKKWVNQRLLWSDLVERLSGTRKTYETYKEFMNMNKSDQHNIKDAGGYVGGYLKEGKRSPQSVGHRQLLTLDLDFATMDFWDDYTLMFGSAAVLHGTHKHSEDTPRFRLVIPLSRKVNAEEYAAISRQVAYHLDIDLFDDTTFEVNRLMFWPTTPRDVEYYFRMQDGPWLDADEVLNEYEDWTDSTLWPTSSRRQERFERRVSKQADPEEKKGIIGAFCKTHDIHSVIETYLSDCYTAAIDGRYTYVGGSTAAGLIVYDDKFAYSHHGTDPCSGLLCNSFDLVRIHKFGELDEDFDIKSTKSESFKRMKDLAMKDGEVKATLAAANIDSAILDFSDEINSEEDVKRQDWLKELEFDRDGSYKSCAKNISLVVANDPVLRGAIKQNTFDNKKYLFKQMPWRRAEEHVKFPDPIKDVDISGVRNYIETVYSMSGNSKIDDALLVEIEKHSFHPVRKYLSGLKWDGTKRVDTLLIRYFGADDSIYSREAIRKMLVGAVARIFNPGCKFDLALILVGAQGTGKSTFIKKLGKDWFSDTFTTVQGKEALEQIQGAWLIEMAELAGLRKAEVEAIKHFISKQDDSFRKAFGRVPETYKRQCVFFGTTNNAAFLRDPSGNRRFLPIDVHSSKATNDIFSDEMDKELDQIWAEAVNMFRNGEKLFLSPAADKLAKLEQIGHSEEDERKGLISAYVDTKLPVNWRHMDVYERREYLDKEEKDGKEYRDYVCIAEIWCECLGKPKEDMTRYNTREINDIMQHFEGWERSKSTKNFPIYGVQKYFKREL